MVDPTPIFCQEMQDTTVSDQDDLGVFPSALDQLPQPNPDVPRPRLELGSNGEKLAALGLVVPARSKQAEVNLLAELCLQRVRVGADIAGKYGHLLGLRDGDDLLPRLDGGGKRAQAGVQGPTHRRCSKMSDLVVRREALAQLVALGLSQGSEERVFQLLVLITEVMETLRMAHEMDDRGHDGAVYVRRVIGCRILEL